MDVNGFILGSIESLYSREFYWAASCPIQDPFGLRWFKKGIYTKIMGLTEKSVQATMRIVA